MSLTSSGRTWDEASSPAALRAARRFESAWRDAPRPSARPAVESYLAEADGSPGAQLALLRAEMGLRWESGERVAAEAYSRRFPDLSSEALVALVYEEFCLREEAGDTPDPEEYLARYPAHAEALRRVLDIHGLVGSVGTTATIGGTPTTPAVPFPKAGETIAGFRLVEELGRGAFARVFLAEERQLADRPVALKVDRTGTREPQTLARLQHTHIVPVHSYRTDPATGLHLLCMPYFGRVTLARLLADPKVKVARGGADILEALDRLGASEPPPAGRSAGRAALARRPYALAVAWWGARMAEALDHAHDRGVLHRDVKPSNVLVTRDGLPMLLDFNLARAAVVPSADDSGSSPIGGGPGGDVPGGTLDYMSPEHIEELASGVCDRVDPRSDVFGLGVLLYEALAGSRPFPPPARGALSAAEMLRRAADDRRAGPPRLREARPDVPAALDAVVRRCLEPDPARRYVNAAELATDLQAVADDRPLRYAREPLPDRAYRFVRRHRRVLAAATPAVLAAGVVAGLLGVEQLERSRVRSEVEGLYEAGVASEDAGDFALAVVQYDAAARLAEQPDAAKLRAQIAALRQRDQRARPTSWSSLEELHSLARRRARMAERTGREREDADALFRAAESLRFRLTGFGGDLPAAAAELKRRLDPFYVFDPTDWLRRPDIGLLDPGRQARIREEVNELLYLYAVALDRAAEQADRRGDADAAALAREQGVEVCTQALRWAVPAAPWQELSDRLRGGGDPSAPAQATRARRPDDEPSPLACFQWGALRLRQGRRADAIAWFRKATRLAPGRYWYHFDLAFAYDDPSPPGDLDEALKHYDVAVALRPDAPWVRFGRARLYRARRAWGLAMADFQHVLSGLGAIPESGRDPGFEQQVRLELGLLRQSLGDAAGARAEYARVIAADPSGSYARAARVNRAKLDADSGAVDRARAEYDALVADRPDDPEARLGRALLALRLGRPAAAESDLTATLRNQSDPAERAEALAYRAKARLALGQPAEALADAEAARAARPGPPAERLRTRALVALGRADALNLDGPEDLDALPLGGPALRADLRRLAARLGAPAPRVSDVDPSAESPESVDDGLADTDAQRDRYVRAVVLAALGETDAAAAAADAAVARAPLATRPYLVRARVHRRAGRADRARADVERARAIDPDDPRVWELRGILRLEAGDPAGALDDLDRAIALGDEGSVRAPRAAAHAALGDVTGALHDWGLALTHDPEDPAAYLGRARSFLRLGQRDQALADLEQAAGWAEGRRDLAWPVALTYARCLPDRPDQLPRLVAWLRRNLASAG